MAPPLPVTCLLCRRFSPAQRTKLFSVDLLDASHRLPVFSCFVKLQRKSPCVLRKLPQFILRNVPDHTQRMDQRPKKRLVFNDVSHARKNILIQENIADELFFLISGVLLRAKSSNITMRKYRKSGKKKGGSFMFSIPLDTRKRKN